jgi:thioredoxin-dependent peroxiredoxin
LGRTNEEEGGDFMKERTGLVTTRGNPLTLLGDDVKVGSGAPDFVALDPNLTPIKFSSYQNKICVISSVPSLDTPVCDTETRKFNEEASKLGDKVQILTLSMDLPFAQKRWCGAAGVNKIQTLSDHRDAQFGLAYGVLIKELRLLARAVFLVDQKGILRYMQLVKDITNEPNYEEIWSALKKLQ